MEGSVSCTVILQSIKIPCLKKRWEMAAIQSLGAWGSTCWAKFPFGLRENKSLKNSSCPCPEGVREDTSLLRTSPPAWGGSYPRGTGPPGAVPAGSSLLCCLRDQLRALSHLQMCSMKRRIQGLLCLYVLSRPGEWMYVQKTWAIFGCPVLQ